MKKLKIAILALILSFVSIFGVHIVAPSSNALSGTSFTTTKSEFEQTTRQILSDYSKFTDRIAGSDGEKLAASYIKLYLDELDNCEPFSNSYIEEGIQSFRFDSMFDGKTYISNNVIYVIPGSENAEKKLLLTCGYDAVTFKADEVRNMKIVEGESINQSAGSVALMLTLAKYLPANTFDFDIELVFFGASSSYKAGSKFFTDGVSKEDSENILAAINFDTVSLGENLYFYIDEIDTKFSNYVEETLSDDEFEINKVNISNLCKILDVTNELGLNYTHVAQDSNNINLMNAGITTINLFAGDYDSGITVGRTEFEDAELVTYTANDSLTYIDETFGKNAITDNLYRVFSSVFALLNQTDFITMCTNSHGDTNLFYKIFGNYNLVILFTAIIFLVFIGVAFYIHFKLSIKSYDAVIESEFVSTVLTITANYDTKSQDDDIPRAIGDIVAEDIKRDKRIKKKK